MTDLNQLRQEFEAAITAEMTKQLMAMAPGMAVADCHEMVTKHWLVRKGDGYDFPVPNMAWWAWQKSRADAVVDLTMLIHQDDNDSLAYYLAGDVELAIRGAGVGLKVTP